MELWTRREIVQRSGLAGAALSAFGVVHAAPPARAAEASPDRVQLVVDLASIVTMTSAATVAEGFVTMYRGKSSKERAAIDTALAAFHQELPSFADQDADARRAAVREMAHMRSSPMPGAYEEGKVPEFISAQIDLRRIVAVQGREPDGTTHLRDGAVPHEGRYPEPRADPLDARGKRRLAVLIRALEVVFEALPARDHGPLALAL